MNINNLNFLLSTCRNIITANLNCELAADKMVKLLEAVDTMATDEKDSILNIMGRPVPQDLLWKATIMHGIPHNMFLGPPSSFCLQCHSALQLHHQPSTVLCYTLEGPIPALKVTLRCESCRLNYRYEQYGNQQEGYRYYEEQRPMVHASQVVYMDRLWQQLGM